MDLKLTCGRIHTIGFRRDSDFVLVLVGKSKSSCKPPEPRDIMPLMPLMPFTPLHARKLFGKVPLEMASIERGRDSVDEWSG